MKYTVTWDPEAEEALTRLWLDHPNERAEIAGAANRIERFLRTDPERTATFHEGLWRMIAVPLSVLFEIVPDDRIVRVTSVAKMTG